MAYTPKTIVKGDDLMLFRAVTTGSGSSATTNYESLAYATSHVLTINGETSDVSSKDHGVYGSTSVNKITWEITSENLYTSEDYDILFDAMIARTPITVCWGTHDEDSSTGTVADGDYECWTADLTAGAYKGNVLITSLVANANSGEDATYSVTLTGTGKIEKVTPND